MKKIIILCLSLSLLGCNSEQEHVDVKPPLIVMSIDSYYNAIIVRDTAGKIWTGTTSTRFGSYVFNHYKQGDTIK